MKRWFAIAMVVVLVFSLAACGSGSPAPSSPSEVASISEVVPKVIKIGVCIYKFDDNFMAIYRSELEKYIKSLETDAVQYDITIVDGKNDQAEQISQIQAFIADKVDVLFVNLVHRGSAADVIALVKAANIPTVFINREPSEEDMGLWDRISHVGADARQSAIFQGEMINALPDKGDINGDGVVGCMLVRCFQDSGLDPMIYDRTITTVTDSGMQVNIFDVLRGVDTQDKSREAVALVLAKYGKAVEVVFCDNDLSALGAKEAIDDAGRIVGKDIYLVGIDALDEAVELVQNGDMTGTIKNDLEGQVHQAAETALMMVDGRPFEKYYWIDYIKITPSSSAA